MEYNSVYVWSTTLTTLVLISYYSFCKKTHIIASVKLHPQEVFTNSFRLCDLWMEQYFDSANGIYMKVYTFSSQVCPTTVSSHNPTLLLQESPSPSNYLPAKYGDLNWLSRESYAPTSYYNYHHGRWLWHGVCCKKSLKVQLQLPN